MHFINCGYFSKDIIKQTSLLLLRNITWRHIGEFPVINML